MLNKPAFYGLVALWLFVIAPASGQRLSDAAEKVRAQEAKWNDAFLKGDIVTAQGLFDDDFVITTEEGKIYSKAGYLAVSADKSYTYEVSEYQDVKVRTHGNTAIATGLYKEKGKHDGKPFDYKDRFTEVWMNKGGNWLLVAAHYSLLPK